MIFARRATTVFVAASDGRRSRWCRCLYRDPAAVRQARRRQDEGSGTDRAATPRILVGARDPSDYARIELEVCDTGGSGDQKRINLKIRFPDDVIGQQAGPR